jgi:Secretion system C-terminal sorting domain
MMLPTNVLAFSIAPNPSKDFACLTISDDLSNQDFTIEVFDMVGRPVAPSTKSFESLHCIGLVDLADGLYFVRVANAQGQSATKQLIVQR